MSKQRKSFIVHFDSLNVLDDLTDEQAGLLFKAIRGYQLGDELELDALTKVAFSPFKNQFTRDAEKYENLCEKNRLIAINRHATKSTSGTLGNQTLPKSTKSTDNDSKSDSDSKSKNDSKSKEISTSAKKHSFSEVDYQCAEWFYSLVIKVAPKAKKPNLEKWADVIRLMRTIDNISHDEISNVFMWANSDSFWKVNILSVTKFRDKFAQLQAKMQTNSAPKASTRTAGNLSACEDFING